MAFKAAIFDLDGTLLNSIADIGNSTNKVLEKHGYPTWQLDKYNGFVGNGLKIMIERALNIKEPLQYTKDGQDYSAIVEQCLSEMIEDYEKNCTLFTRPYDGIMELLDILYDKGYVMGILSNKAQYLTERIVGELINKEKKYISYIIGEREGYPNKPDPAGAEEIVKLSGVPKQQFIYVGDTGTDMLTAKNAGIYSFGVTWGFRSREELVEHGACQIVDKPSEILCGIN